MSSFPLIEIYLLAVEGGEKNEGAEWRSFTRQSILSLLWLHCFTMMPGLLLPALYVPSPSSVLPAVEQLPADGQSCWKAEHQNKVSRQTDLEKSLVHLLLLNFVILLRWESKLSDLTKQVHCSYFSFEQDVKILSRSSWLELLSFQDELETFKRTTFKLF